MLEKCVIGTLVTNEPAESAVKDKQQQQPQAPVKANTLGIKGPAMLAPLAVSKPNEMAWSASEPEPLTVTVVSKPEVKLIKVSSKDGSAEIPVLDSYQTNEYVNVVIYTKWKKMKLDNVIIDKLPATGQTFTLVLYIYAQLATYRYSIDIPAPVKDDYDLKLSKDGKIDLIIFKVEKIHWWQM